jgi:hypothetical protein
VLSDGRRRLLEGFWLLGGWLVVEGLDVDFMIGFVFGHVVNLFSLFFFFMDVVFIFIFLLFYIQTVVAAIGFSMRTC